MKENKDNYIKQFVVFKLDKEEYGVDIQKVTTIERVLTVARVPKTPDYVTGVINLRGEIIPIIDLRKKFKLPPVDETDDTRIIIIKIGDISAGIVVDSVAEVTEISEESVESVASFNTEVSMDYILGVGKLENRIITLLNLEKLVSI